ncbi:chromosome condensation regulator RCC1 [Pyxidicoccus parkwayensis]|uniref:Chromosome condensation regulator RCC1 n=1 Tax=Pyxidicoccus parkwayensis TaxID=2813578 RepID=A0ABX7NTF8_9BACT|nr:chromosome condensation regulator RCC1 [Pyxidicoccus parkwaysis]QSQ22185.1 chromosome condensation regulator RCC1 [Pyxidicoccus parkwaysis]
MKCFRPVPALLALWLLAACGSDVASVQGVPAPPSIQVLTPETGASFDEPAVRLSGTVGTAAGLASLTARVDDGDARAATVTETQPGHYTFTVDLVLPPGESVVRLEAEDATGVRDSRTLRLRHTPDTTAPRVQVLSPVANQAFGVRRVSVDARVTDDRRVVSVAYVLNGGEEQTVQAKPDEAGALVFELTPKPGPNALVLRARDAYGNVGESTVAFHFGGLATAGALHSGLLRDGRVHAWGRNNRGQLGLGAAVTADQKQPRLVPGLEGVAAIAFNQNFSVALRSDGTVWTWGENADGQLGLGTPPAPGEPHTPDVTLRREPSRVPGLEGAVAVALGYRHALVLMEDGTVRAFGNNADGQLGDGTLESRDYPVTVQGLTDVVKVVGGSQHSAALKADGTVWVWGRNSYGNLGSGSADTAGHPAPVRVPELEHVVDLANGRDHLLALHADGSVSAWGLDASGQLGAGAPSVGDQSATPVKVKGLTDARAVFANGNFSFAVRVDGTLVSWGQNGNGQLCVGDKTDRAEPTPVATEVNPVATMGMGATHVLALRQDGSLYGWGWNLNGSLGSEAVIDRWSYTNPIAVPVP